ncbi:hypothetical protein VPH35_004682 [Triticum aestivum]
MNGGMHLLEDAPPPADDIHGNNAFWGTRDHWSWSNIPTPPPFCVAEMVSSAVHPEGGGRTLFVSGKISDMDDLSICTPQTFSYDTGTGEWRCHGEWDLPFRGQAHYDAELDVWVGLHKKSEPFGNLVMDGFICSCDLASPCGSHTQPTWKVCDERFNYCLVEVMAREKFESRRCVDVGNKCEIRVAMFRLKYGKNGELIITARRPERSYLFSTFHESSKVSAFWM